MMVTTDSMIYNLIKGIGYKGIRYKVYGNTRNRYKENKSIRS
jgi:hypothetical protein